MPFARPGSNHRRNAPAFSFRGNSPETTRVGVSEDADLVHGRQLRVLPHQPSSDRCSGLPASRREGRESTECAAWPRPAVPALNRGRRRVENRRACNVNFREDDSRFSAGLGPANNPHRPAFLTASRRLRSLERCKGTEAVLPPRRFADAGRESNSLPLRHALPRRRRNRSEPGQARSRRTFTFSAAIRLRQGSRKPAPSSLPRKPPPTGPTLRGAGRDRSRRRGPPGSGIAVRRHRKFGFRRGRRSCAVCRSSGSDSAFRGVKISCLLVLVIGSWTTSPIERTSDRQADVSAPCKNNPLRHIGEATRSSRR